MAARGRIEGLDNFCLPCTNIPYQGNCVSMLLWENKCSFIGWNHNGAVDHDVTTKGRAHAPSSANQMPRPRNLQGKQGMGVHSGFMSSMGP